MTAESVIYVGTMGESIFRSRDGGVTFTRISNGMFVELDVRALSVHPQNPRCLYAGSNAGLYRTEDGGENWQRLDTSFDPGKGWPGGVNIWSLLVHPTKPDTLFVGTCPPALYRSQDGGETWQELNADLSPTCGGIVYPRLTCIAADPTDPETFWVGIEIDGARRSTDGGASWQKVSEGLSSQDIHAIVVIPGEPKTLVAATNNDLNVSMDNGERWTPQNIKTQFPWGYCRGLAQKPDDLNTIYSGNGNGPPGSEGAIQISRDGGRSWKMVDLPVSPNSTIWTFATASTRPNWVAAASVNGQIFLSENAGETWSKLAREFGEIRSLALTSA